MARESWRARPLVLEMARRMLVLDGHRTELPIKEFELLAALAARPGEAVSAKELIEKVWPESSLMTSHDLYWYVWSLRKLIGDGDREAKLIANRRGIGYYLDLPPEGVEVLEKGHAVIEEDPPHEEAMPEQLEEIRSVKPAAELRIPAANETVITAPPRKPLLAIGVAAASAAMVAISWLGGYWLSNKVESQRPTDRLVTTPDPSPSDSNPQLGYKSKPQKTKQERHRKRPHNQKGSNRGGVTSDGGGGATVVPGGGTVITTTGGSPSTSDSNPDSGGGSGGSKQDQSKDNSPDRSTRPAKEEPKEPPPPPQPTAVLYHLYHPKTEDHLTTTSSSVSNQKQAYGYRSSSEGRVFSSQIDGTVAISLSDSTVYIYKNASAAPEGHNISALYRCSGDGETFFTTNPAEADQAQARGWSNSTVGYVGS